MAEQFLDVGEMKNWADTIFTAMERAGIASVPLDQRYYHSFLDSSAAFDMGKAPDTGVGDLHDDILDLRNEMNNYRTDEGVVLFHALDHLQGLIGFLAHASGGTVAFLDVEETP